YANVLRRRSRNLPLELRYTARIIRALQWGFADFDSANIRIDKDLGFSESDLQQLDQGHRLRAAQFCLFLKALYGAEKMKSIMAEALEYAKQRYAGQSPRIVERRSRADRFRVSRRTRQSVPVNREMDTITSRPDTAGHKKSARPALRS